MCLKIMFNLSGMQRFFLSDDEYSVCLFLYCTHFISKSPLRIQYTAHCSEERVH